MKNQDNIVQTAVVKKPGPLKKFMSYLGLIVVLLSLVINIYLLMFFAVVTDDSEMSRELIASGKADTEIAVYEISGVIDDSKAFRFDKFYHDVKDKDNVKAILLRVDSPGGTVSASERIANQIILLKNQGKKIVVSMGGLAASGGYLISAPADMILAENATITGSIGVIAQLPNIEGLLKKLGIKVRNLKSRDAKVWKDLLSPTRPAKEYEIQRMYDILDQMQESFSSAVKQGRGDRLKISEEIVTVKKGDGDKIKPVTVKTIAPLNGKIYTAKEALKNGLIDKIGYFEDAIAETKQLADLDKPRVVRYEYISKAEFIRSLIFGKSQMPEVIEQTVIDSKMTRFMMIWRIQN